MVINVITDNSIIWNKDDVIMNISYAMSIQSPIIIELGGEGPCAKENKLYSILEKCSKKFNYDLTHITLVTSNKLEEHPLINIVYVWPIVMVNNARDSYKNHTIYKQITKYFGIFIGKSNEQRLILNAYLYSKYKNKIIQTYRYDINDDYYMNNIGLENTIVKYKNINASNELNFLKKCPIIPNGSKKYNYKKNANMNLSQQLDVTNNISKYYSNFFVELVCESYYTGNTFFPTEKVWRPMLLKTPFILQGPQHYLKNLKIMGFRTFDKWWDEGYDEDPECAKNEVIIKVIDWIMEQDVITLRKWYCEMEEILEHNYNLVIKLTKYNFME